MQLSVVMKNRVFLYTLSLLFWSFSVPVIRVVSQQTIQNRGLELPKIVSTDQIVKHIGYTLSYSEVHEQAKWVAYVLTAEETSRIVKRSNKFKVDPEVKTGSAEDADYKHSGYDRGHLAPAADMGWSSIAMQESFFYSNMSPQIPAFNRGIWKTLEELVRQWAIENSALLIVTGPILEDNLPKIGPNGVSVPRYYYKVIVDYIEPEIKGIGFIIPNEGSNETLQNFAVPIDSVQRVTRINFFAKIPIEQQKEIERKLCKKCWTW